MYVQIIYPQTVPWPPFHAYLFRVLKIQYSRAGISTVVVEIRRPVQPAPSGHGASSRIHGSSVGYICWDELPAAVIYHGKLLKKELFATVLCMGQ